MVSVERLIDDLWDGDPPATAANVVHTMIGHLRKALEPSRAPGAAGEILETAAPGYRLRIRPGELDVHQDEALVAEGRGLLRADPASAAERLRAALALWRGPALADIAGARFSAAEAAGLEDRRLGATEEQVEADIALGRHADLVAELEALLGRHPLRERLCGQLMLCLYRWGARPRPRRSSIARGSGWRKSSAWIPGRSCSSSSSRSSTTILVLERLLQRQSHTPRGPTSPSR